MCRFRHDKMAAKKEKRCMSCGIEGHFRSECPTGSSEGKVSGEVGSGSSAGNTAAKATPTPKPKAPPQVKGVEEAQSNSGTTNAPTGGNSKAQEALLAEAAKLRKGLVLKPLRIQGSPEARKVNDPAELGISQGWLMSVVASVSDPMFAFLVDSGATNALRQAEEGELSQSRVINVDLARGATRLHANAHGATRLHANAHGTLLSSGPCQMILPACYLLQLGFVIAWKARGCTIKRRGEVPLQVKVIKRCLLFPERRVFSY